MIELTSGGVFDELESDAKAREDILTQIRETLFVEAGAGTGKTTSLVGRIVSLVANGVSLSNVAAITFTEKAAAELKDRVREELEKAVSTEATPAEIRALHQAALDELDGAAIQTLHSFAQRILSQYPIEAGLPPRIEMRDDIAAHLAFDVQWNSFLDRLLEGETSDLPLERAVLLGLEIAKLKDVALSFHDHWDRLRMQGALFEGGDPKAEVDVRALLDGLEETTGALEMCAKADCDDKLEAHIRNIFVPYEARLRAAQSDEERMIILADGTWLAGVKGWGIGGHWVGPTKSEVHASRDAATEERDRLLSELRTACIGPILEEVRRFVLSYAAERRANGELEFHDLLVLARDLLRDNAEARKRLGERYQKLLIDEFQDTDPVQIEIAALLASHFDGAAPAWDAIAVESGRLFFVGDPKQSIYRFRSANIELYERAHERFGQETRRLTQNFRSGPGIIAWVNEVFGQLFEEHRGVGQVEYVPLTPRLGAEDRSLQTVRLLGGPQGGDGRKATAGRVRRREAPEIVQAIRAIRADKWAVGDGTQDGSRAAQYADITILLPARTALPPLERALEDADIPFRVESQSLLYATQEVRDLISILAAIDDPTDQVAVVAALRSPAFACSDQMLEEYARAGGRWDYRGSQRTEEALTKSHPVVEALAALHELHDGRWFESVSGQVEKVIRERHLFEVAFAHRRPRETWQRLRFVQERARAFVDGGGATLRQFVAWLRAQAEAESRVVESVVPETDDDAVRIMTVHAAKGLEFPIVILAGLNTKPTERFPSVIWDSEQQPHVRIGRKGAGFATTDYESARQREGQMDQLEKDRLLYVAATRARDHLIVSLHHGVTAKGCHAERLDALRGDAESWHPGDSPADRSAPEVDSRGFEDTPQARERWLTQRGERLEGARKERVLAATAIAHGARGVQEGEAEKAEQDDEEAPWRRGRAGTSIGRAVHAVLQSIDLANPAGLRETVNAQALGEGVSGREREIEALVLSALDSGAVREAVASGKYWREVYLAAPIGDALVEGFIDLLYEGPDGLVVVDYKTDAARTDAERDLAVERYRLQGAAYALAVNEALGREVARCVFVFAKAGGAHERAVVDLPGAISEVRAFVTGEATPLPVAVATPIAATNVEVRQPRLF